VQTHRHFNSFLKVCLVAALAGFLSACQNPENFDTATVPNLPAGWTTAGTSGTQWVTVSDATPDRPADSGHISAFLKAENSQDVGLISPIITLANGGISEALLKHRCKVESGWDGAILEVSINGGPFVNVTTYNSFSEGGYTGSLIFAPFGVTSGWTGENDYVTSRITLPSVGAGGTLRFKFRGVSDSVVSTVGSSVDSVALRGADLVVTQSDSKDPVKLGSVLTFTITVTNNGPLDAQSVNLWDILPQGFNLTSTTLSQGSFVTPNAPVLRANFGSIVSGGSAVMTVTGVAPASIPHAPIVEVDHASSLGRDVVAGEASFGPALNSTGVSGLMILAADGSGDTEDACQALPAGFATDKILIARQSAGCSFNQQVGNAQAAGAIGTIIYNNASSDALVSMGSSGIAVSIPSVYVGAIDGLYLKNAISSGTSVTLRSVSSSIANEARSASNQWDPALQNSFATEFTVVAPDSDSDGVPDPADGCPTDNGKASPGICGCGVPDVDSNSNGVLDCLATPELKAQAISLNASLSALKLLGTHATKKQISAQKTAKSNLKRGLNSISSFINSSGINVHLLSTKVTLAKYNSQIKSAISAALKLKSSFAADKKKAAKLLKALIAVIG